MKKNTLNIGKIERRFSEGEVSTGTVEAENRNVMGYAAKFNQLSKKLRTLELKSMKVIEFRERLLPGCFDGVDMADVVALFNHDENLILARTSSKTLTLGVDDIGLPYSFESPETSAGNDLLVSIRRKDITGSSFAFSVKEDRWIEDPADGLIREVVKIDRLFDVSPVINPAYEDSEVEMDSRSFDEYQKTIAPQYNDLADCEAELELRKSFINN